jgi:hypothetical protein
MVMVKASTSMFFTDFLSVPKIMGIGPIMMTPAARTLPFLGPCVEAKIIAATIIMVPMTTKAKPNSYKTARFTVSPQPQHQDEPAFLINVVSNRLKCKKLKAPTLLYRVGAK